MRPELAFWRTRAGGEVDFLVRAGWRLIAVEIKLSASIDRHAVAGLRQCMRDLSLKHCLVIANTTERRTIGRDITVVPWNDVVARTVDIGHG